MSGPNENFVVQQGLQPVAGEACVVLTSALVFQPRMVGLLALVAAVLQSGVAFLVLAAVLWWSALAPRWNPFDLVYNGLLAGRSSRPRLTPAPAPRRFAQSLAGAFSASIGLCLLGGARGAAVAVGVVFFLAIGAIALGRLCVGSFVYHLLRGRVRFALRTLPWGRGA